MEIDAHGENAAICNLLDFYVVIFLYSVALTRAASHSTNFWLPSGLKRSFSFIAPGYEGQPQFHFA
jgi:integral membrane sensor domain MASE1